MNIKDLLVTDEELQATIVLRYRPPLCCRSARFVVDHDRDHFPISLLDQTTESEIDDAISEINRMLKMTSSFRWRLWPGVILLVSAALSSVYFVFSLFDASSIAELMPWATHDNLIMLSIITLSAAVILLLFVSCVAQLRNASKMQGIRQVIWYLNNRFVGRLYWQLSTDSKQCPIIIIREASAAYMIGADQNLANTNGYVPVAATATTGPSQGAVRMTSYGCRQQ